MSARSPGRRLAGLLETLWFLPGLVVVAFTISALVLSYVEARTDTTDLPGVFPGGAEAARSILSTVAASIITVAGLTLSITMVVLQLVSSQYTPRALRQVLRDRLTQLTSGVFVGVFVFSLVILRSVRDDNVPALGVTLSIVFGVGALLLLLAFINNVAQNIQVEAITARTGRETVALVESHYPADRPDEAASLPDLPSVTRVLRPRTSGYVQAVDDGVLERGLPGEAPVIEILVRAGDFVTPGSDIAAIRGHDDGDIADVVVAAVQLADHRALGQDEAFGLRLLADIALRALSPGINDPTTAITALDHAGAILQSMARRYDRPRTRRLGTGSVVVEAYRPFRELLEPVVEVGRYCSDPRTLDAALSVLSSVGRAALEGDQPAHAADVDDAVRAVLQASSRAGESRPRRVEVAPPG